MTVKVIEIKCGCLFGINLQTGSRESFRYFKKIGGDFDIKAGSLITVAFEKDKHQPKKITKVIECIN